jgi:hypothetical protein
MNIELNSTIVAGELWDGIAFIKCERCLPPATHTYRQLHASATFTAGKMERAEVLFAGPKTRVAELSIFGHLR